MNINAVIFDLDGTLYDNSKIARSFILRSLLHLRLIGSERKCRHEMAGKYYGDNGEAYAELFSKMAAKSGHSARQAEKWFWDKYMPIQVSTLRNTRHRKPWVDNVLSDLKSKGIKIACFSDYGMVKEKLEALGISPSYFDYIVDAPSIGGLKPCKEAFLNVARHLEVAPEEALVVGDREDTDGLGAKAAGMQFMLVSQKDSQEVRIDLKPKSNHES